MDMPDKTKQRLLRLALCIPFLLGLSWTLCHPIISIITGELKCRGIFIDEHALDPLQYSTDPYPASLYDPIAGSELPGSLDEDLCSRLTASFDNVNHSPSCLTTLDFNMVKILPFHSTPVTIPTEAIVLIIPSPSAAYAQFDSSQEIYFERLLHQLIGRLQNSSWLAKTIFIVVPKNYKNKLETAVYNFLAAYLGEEGVDRILPPSYNMFLIRQLLVIDLYSLMQQEHRSTSSLSTQVHVLPQGPRGLLPNLDLVFVTIQTLGRILPTHRKVAVHPLDMTEWENFVSQQVQSWKLGSWWYTWGIELANLGAFAATMIRGPHGPHYPALERGIDSITIQLRPVLNANNKLNLSSMSQNHKNRFNNAGNVQDSMILSQLFESTEHIVRALSNLHERLHHSVHLYLLPSPTKFVSHGEYIYPCILILLPFVIRAASLLFIHINYFQCRFVISSILIMTLHSSLVYFTAPYMNTMIIAMVYVSLILSWRRLMKFHVMGKSANDLRQSLQFVACLFVIYSHAPLVLCHVSLAYPSAVYWAIILGFPCYCHTSRGNESLGRRLIERIASVVIVVLAWPPTFAVPYVFQDYTAYICLVYIPLHFFFTLLVFQGFYRTIR